MSGFDLRATCLAALDKAESPDPAVVADQVAESIDSRYLRVALRAALRSYMPSLVARQRTRRPDPSPGNGSSKWRSASDRLHVAFAIGDRQWKWLRDCTADDLMAGVDARRALAAGTIREADRYEALAKLVAERGVGTVGGLSSDDLDEVLG